jgi:hypothetical protein
MFNILEVNANQNHTEIPSYPSQISNHQENKQDMGARMLGRKELSYTAGWNGNHYGNQYGISSEN